MPRRSSALNRRKCERGAERKTSRRSSLLAPEIGEFRSRTWRKSSGIWKKRPDPSIGKIASCKKISHIWDKRRQYNASTVVPIGIDAYLWTLSRRNEVHRPGNTRAHRKRQGGAREPLGESPAAPHQQSIASNWGVRCDNSQRASVTEDSDQLRQYPFKDKRSGSILS